MDYPSCPVFVEGGEKHPRQHFQPHDYISCTAVEVFKNSLGSSRLEGETILPIGCQHEAYKVCIALKAPRHANEIRKSNILNLYNHVHLCIFINEVDL